MSYLCERFPTKASKILFVFLLKEKEITWDAFVDLHFKAES